MDKAEKKHNQAHPTKSVDSLLDWWGERHNLQIEIWVKHIIIEQLLTEGRAMYILFILSEDQISLWWGMYSFVYFADVQFVNWII